MPGITAESDSLRSLGSWWIVPTESTGLTNVQFAFLWMKNSLAKIGVLRVSVCWQTDDSTVLEKCGHLTTWRLFATTGRHILNCESILTTARSCSWMRKVARLRVTCSLSIALDDKIHPKSPLATAHFGTSHAPVEPHKLFSLMMIEIPIRRRECLSPSLKPPAL